MTAPSLNNCCSNRLAFNTGACSMGDNNPLILLLLPLLLLLLLLRPGKLGILYDDEKEARVGFGVNVNLLVLLLLLP